MRVNFGAGYLREDIMKRDYEGGIIRRNPPKRRKRGNKLTLPFPRNHPVQPTPPDM
jgi:hypothetical protein